MSQDQHHQPGNKPNHNPSQGGHDQKHGGQGGGHCNQNHQHTAQCSQEQNRLANATLIISILNNVVVIKNMLVKGQRTLAVLMIIV